jgi:predicted nucleic acid-binding protein
MPRDTGRANCFDASALVKIVVPAEDKSDVVKRYFDGEPTKYTTPFCFYEALSALKRKLQRAEITRPDYLKAATYLASWFRASSRSVKDPDFTAIPTFNEAKHIAETTGLDFSDAFQILSVRAGFFSVLARESRTILVTADSALAEAARAADLRVWDVMREPPPT